MIAGLIGNIIHKDAAHVLLHVNGVIYEVFMSLNAIPAAKDNDTIWITQIVREDGISLYGFLDKNEKQVFDSLIKISGVGPKVAMAICSTFKAQDIIALINNNNIANLKRVPGVGDKMAKRIIVEMSGKLQSHIVTSSAKKDALSALETLGFKTHEVLHLVESSNLESAQDIIKEVLQTMKK